MRTIIAGSRGIKDYYIVSTILDNFPDKHQITEVILGGARGVDQLAEIWANENNIPTRVFKANWKEYKKSAGVIRNKEMAKNADMLIAIWDGESKGTANMIKVAKECGLIIHIAIPKYKISDY